VTRRAWSKSCWSVQVGLLQKFRSASVSMNKMKAPTSS
jgi:hypothetical protein